MWYDELPSGKSWAALWSGYILCGQCSGIRRTEGACPACGAPPFASKAYTIQVDGQEVTVQPAFAGAEGRYEDWVYLHMLEREWKRPGTPAEEIPGFQHSQHASPRAAIVVLFWSYFETKMGRLLRAGMHNVPPRLAEDTLRRYSSIGARLDRLYQVLFETTYWADLSDLGFDDVAAHLRHVQSSRNSFAHGEPNAISDALVSSVVENLKREHEAWITVYNRRGARR